MDNETRPFDVDVIGVYGGDTEFPESTDYNVEDVYTEYNGKCKAYHFQNVSEKELFGRISQSQTINSIKNQASAHKFDK